MSISHSYLAETKPKATKCGWGGKRTKRWQRPSISRLCVQGVQLFVQMYNGRFLRRVLTWWNRLQSQLKTTWKVVMFLSTLACDPRPADERGWVWGKGDSQWAETSQCCYSCPTPLLASYIILKRKSCRDGEKHTNVLLLLAQICISRLN